MKKKILAVLLSSMMIVSVLPNIAFASEENQDKNDKMSDTEAIADKLEEYVDKDEINDSMFAAKDKFFVEGKDVNISIPASGSGNIATDWDNKDSILMGLPVDVKKVNGELTDDGTVIYNAQDKNVAVGVQALSDGEDANYWEAVRVLIEIKSINSSREYGFKHNLPNGYRLIYAEDWYNKYILTGNDESDNPQDYYMKGEVYIITGDGTVVETIDPAWAKDANGEDVQTHYQIRGNELVQVIDFNENVAFPVVVSQTTHPDKRKTYYLTKGQVAKVRDKYAETCSEKTKAIISLATGTVAPYGAAWTIIMLVNTEYDNGKRKTWQKIYTNFPSDKKYVKITGNWKWHGGHKAYYPTGKLKTTYVKSK